MSIRVLAAEDSPTQAAVLRSCLEDAGFEIRMARDGVEALALARQHPFDVVVSDVVMPEVGGYELCRGIKATHPDVPVILLTGLEDPLDVIHALEAGADNFLRKPYDPVELVERIRSVLRNRELREAAGTGLELSLLGKRFTVDSGREQILNLLVATFEELVSTNQQLRKREEELARANGEAAARLAETETERERLHGVLAAVPQAMAVVDRHGSIVDINENLARLLGQDPSALRGASVWDEIHLVDHSGTPLSLEQRALAECLSEGRPVTRGEGFDVFLRSATGETRPVISRTAPVLDRNGQVLGAVGTIDDIGRLQLYDPVTGLPGHGILIDRLQSAIDDATQDRSCVGVLVVAIDRFDVLRASLSPSESSEIVAAVSDELERCLECDEVRHRTTAPSLGYLGNAEFAVLLPGAANEADVIFVGEFLSERLPRTADIDGIEVPVTVTVAVGISQGDDDPATVLASAAASARVRREGGTGGVTTSDTALHAAVVQQLQKESELRKAIVNGEIVVHYQPQVQLRGAAPVGVEALARWQHPERGLLGAEEIIPLAEEAGLIRELSWLVLEAACRQVAGWRRELLGAGAMTLSVNVSPAQLGERDVAARLEAILSDAGLEASALVLEITEGSVMTGTGAISDRLAAIKALGAQIAIDDFGTGHSSLLKLRELPVDILKIDRGFVGGMCEEPGDAAIVAASIRLARGLGLEVVAEGVESAEQLVQLRVLGCELGQGYHFAKALPADRVAEWWMDQRLPDQPMAPGTSLVLDDRGDDGSLAYLVHELRTPLVALLGFTQLLSEIPLSDTGRELLEVIVRSAEELDERVNSVRDARDAVQGGMTLELARCDVAEVVGTLVGDMRDQLGPHHVRLESVGDAITAADRTRLVQAVTNLLTNAAKFSPDGSPIDVRVASEGGEVVVSVRDYGPGVPEHRRPELFRRFSRLGSRTKGMGIGLYLSRVAAIAHGGDLSYEPGPDGGSVFSFRIPHRSAVEPAKSPEPTPVEPAQRDLPTGPRTVLYIEDSPPNVALVQRVADGLEGVELLVAVDGLTGIEMARRDQPDLVLLDLHLSDLEGDEVLSELRADPETAHIPVLIASADIADRAGALMAAGAQGVIRKPFDVARLRRLLVSYEGEERDPAVPDRGDDPRSDGSGLHPLDPGMVEALTDLAAMSEQGDIDDVIAAFEDGSTESLQRLVRAVAKHRLPAVAEIAHELAGTTANFGGVLVSQTCRDLEKAARAGDSSMAPMLLSRVAAELQEAIDALRREFPAKVKT